MNLTDLQYVHFYTGTLLYFAVKILMSQFVTSTFLSVMTTSYKNTVDKCEESWAEEVNAFMATDLKNRGREETMPEALREEVCLEHKQPWTTVELSDDLDSAAAAPRKTRWRDDDDDVGTRARSAEQKSVSQL